MRRPRVSWMTHADDLILETLEDSGLMLSPRILAVNNDYSRQHVSRRLAELCEAGLVEKVDDGLYEITDQGRAYLSGDIATEKLDNSD